MGRIIKILLVVLALHISVFSLVACGLGGTDCGNVTCPSSDPQSGGQSGSTGGSSGDEGSVSTGTGGDDPASSPGQEDPQDEEILLQGGG